MESVRSAHVDFVSNHNGSYPSDILLATISGPVSVALTSVVLPFLLPVRYALLTYSSKLWIHLLIETITVICPFLISFTLMSNYSQLNLLLLLLLVFSLMIFSPQLWRVHLPNLNQLFALPLPEKKPPFITNYRAGLNLATCICILAVDFQVFPRRFAKTETYGFSLMDVGVGSFVIANGLVGTSQIPQIQFFTKTLPILLLGVGRLLAVKLSNYHEHITEYGLHWNFFFTLAFVKTISAVITQRYRPLTIAGSLLLVYELLLKLGLESWIISDYPRSNLLSANREGIFSLFGYLAIYYASLELGNYLKKPRNSFGDWFRLLGDLCCLCALSWIGLQLSQSIFGEPSRRLANASFCIWMVYLIIYAPFYVKNIIN